VFYNVSKWTLKSLFSTATNNQQILLANFEEYLNGFSDNVKEIIGPAGAFEREPTVLNPVTTSKP